MPIEIKIPYLTIQMHFRQQQIERHKRTSMRQNNTGENEGQFVAFVLLNPAGRLHVGFSEATKKIKSEAVPFIELK